MINFQLKLIGPGLCVNGPAAIIYHALKEAGYEVDLEEFPGQFQYTKPEEWPQRELDDIPRIKALGAGHVLFDVDACPWGS